MIDLGMMLESSRTCLATTKVWDALGLHGCVLTHVLDHFAAADAFSWCL